MIFNREVRTGWPSLLLWTAAGCLLIASGCARQAAPRPDDEAAPAAVAEETAPPGQGTIPAAEALTSSSADQAAPCFSPDGGTLVYQNNSDGNWELYLLDLEHRAMARLTDTPEAEEAPVFSPDGAWLLCTVHAPTVDPSPPRDILMLRRNGKDRRLIASHGADDWFPRFTPDGAAVVFVSDRVDERKQVEDEERRSAVFRFQLETEELVQLTPGEDESAPWPLEDGRVAYRAADGRLMSVPPAGGPPELLLDPRDWTLGHPVSAGAGRWFMTGQQGEGASMILQHFEGGSELRSLPLDGRSEDRGPALSADGSKLTFFGKRDGQWDLFLIELN